VRTLVDLPIFV